MKRPQRANICRSFAYAPLLQPSPLWVTAMGTANQILTADFVATMSKPVRFCHESVFRSVFRVLALGSDRRPRMLRVGVRQRMRHHEMETRIADSGSGVARHRGRECSEALDAPMFSTG